MATIGVKDSDFDEKVLQSKMPVLVDFWAEWCSPCKIAGPVLEELSETYRDKLVVAKINVDEDQALVAKYQVMSIPTVVLFKHGQEVGRQIGFSGKEMYEELIQKAGGDK